MMLINKCSYCLPSLLLLICINRNTIHVSAKKTNINIEQHNTYLMRKLILLLKIFARILATMKYEIFINKNDKILTKVI